MGPGLSGGNAIHSIRAQHSTARFRAVAAKRREAPKGGRGSPRVAEGGRGWPNLALGLELRRVPPEPHGRDRPDVLVLGAATGGTTVLRAPAAMLRRMSGGGAARDVAHAHAWREAAVLQVQAIAPFRASPASAMAATRNMQSPRHAALQDGAYVGVIAFFTPFGVSSAPSASLFSSSLCVGVDAALCSSANAPCSAHRCDKTRHFGFGHRRGDCSTGGAALHHAKGPHTAHGKSSSAAQREG